MQGRCRVLFWVSGKNGHQRTNSRTSSYFIWVLTVFERVKTHTYGGVRLMLIFLKPRGPSIKDVAVKRGVKIINVVKFDLSSSRLDQ